MFAKHLNALRQLNQKKQCKIKKILKFI